LIVLFGLIFALGVPLRPTIVLLPAVIIIQALFLLGVALFLSALNVFFRDTEVIMEVLILAWFFLTPIFYDIKMLFPAYERLLYWLNPMASIISSYRLILLNGSWPALDFMLRTFGISLVALVVGYLFFVRLSPLFGEEL